jgi:hypothetical protein
VIRSTLLVICSFFLLVATAPAVTAADLVQADASAGAARDTRSQPILPIGEVVPGQIALAKTVFRGTEIDTFSVEIVSVVHRVGPDRDLILGRGLGPKLERFGVAEGMSGSPVYVDGRLVGAISSSWTFAREPLLGITPAEQMAREAAQGLASPSRRASTDPEAGRDLLEGRVPPSPNGSGPVPIRSPLVMSGFDRRLVAFAAEMFEPWGFTVAEGGGAGAEEMGGAIEPGATLGVRLVGGDANMTAIGAVTRVEGDEVHAWGHPFFQMGDVEFPLVQGYIHAIVPSQLMSFKLGSGAKTVGSITADRRSGVFGRLGVLPRLTDVELRVSRGGEERSYHFELVRNRFLTPPLLGITTTNAILAQGGLAGEETVRFRQRLVLGDGRETTVETLFTGAQTLPEVASLLSEAARVLALNPFEEVLLDRVEASLVFEPEVRLAALTAVTVDRDSLEPGDVLRGGYTLRDWRGGEKRHRFSIPLPETAREGRYLLLVADAPTAEMYEAERAPRSVAPRDLDELLERMRSLRQPNEVHVLLYRASQGVLIDGRPLPDLPPSTLAVMRSAARSGTEEDLPAELVAEQRLPLDRLVQGGHTILLEVRKEKP